jgi:hypothetical protein
MYRGRRLTIVDGLERRRRIRSFALGGLVGAAGAIAAGRRLRRSERRSREQPAGLAAFEDAPCFRELAERRARGGRQRAD